MVQHKQVKDIRSTGRRRARRALYEDYVPYKCSVCGRTSREPPKDAPTWFDDIWPEENRVLDYPLQADHETKDLYDNYTELLSWKCSPCHKKADSQTGKGESTVETRLF